VLVVVHDGNVQLVAQPRLDLEAFGGLDVLEVDAAEGGGDGPHGAHEGVGVGLGHLDVEGVDAGEGLEQHTLPLHYGFGGQRADIAQSEYGRAVRHDGHEVALARVVVDLLRRLGDDARGNGHAGRIGQRKVVLRAVGLRGNDADFSGALFAVVAQRLLGEFIVGCHCFSLFFG